MKSAELAVIERETAELKPGASTEEVKERVSRIVSAVQRLQSQLADQQIQLEEMMAALAISPEAKGRRIVTELQSADGGAWSGADLERRFGLSPAVLHRRRKEFRIVYWRDAQHDYFYPQWQFNEAGAILPGIEAILKLFKSVDEWRVMRYFLGSRKQLGDRRPLDLIRSGEIEAVINHARIHAAENTW